MKIFRAALIGIGGFGAAHVAVMISLADEGLIEVSAFAELNAQAYPESFDKLTSCGARHYTDYEQMLADRPDIDFVVIATPIAAHKTMCIRAMELGFHVLVEKPPAVTIQDLDEMIAVQQATGRLCQVNFQNTSGSAFRELLAQLAAGAVGRVARVTGVGMWMRTRAYYDRTRWAGKLIYNGHYVLDGTFNNPFAHLLHNCLLAAEVTDGLDHQPERVQAELYHVNDIEGDDVSCIRVGMSSGVTVNFYAMLSHERNDPPFIVVRGSEGEISWNYENKLSVSKSSGKENYTYGSEDLMRSMYLNLMAGMEDAAVQLYSPIAACRSFVLVSNGAYESAGTIHAIPAAYVREEEKNNSSVRLLPALSAQMTDVAEKGLLYSEYPFPWGKASAPVELANYNHFELLRRQ